MRFGMRTSEIIKEIQRLPVQKRIIVVEKTIHSLRMDQITNQMKKASDSLYSDYASDLELLAFTTLDFDDFYETR